MKRSMGCEGTSASARCFACARARARASARAFACIAAGGGGEMTALVCVCFATDSLSYYRATTVLLRDYSLSLSECPP